MSTLFILVYDERTSFQPPSFIELLVHMEVMGSEKYAAPETHGDQAYLEGNFVAAYYFFGKCLLEIGLKGDKRLTILWKRALSSFQLDCYQQALVDCDEILAEKIRHECYTLKIKCLWGLGLYGDAVKYLGESGSDCDQDFILKSKTAILHSEGKLDMVQLVSLPKSRCHYHIGEYYGNYKVVTIPRKGRGLVATADLKAGELVILTKAFSVSFISEVSQEGDVKELCRQLLCWRVFQRIHFNSQLRKQFCDLSTDKRSLMKGDWLRNQWLGDRKLKDSMEKDNIMTEIGYKVANNVFGWEHGLGIWLQASYLNHSCVDFNVARSIFGNVMVVRAVKDIKSGDELTLAYVNPTEGETRQRILNQHDMICDCRLCQMDSKEDNCAKQEVDITLGKIKNCTNLLEKVELFKFLRNLRNLTENFSLLDSSVLELGGQLYDQKEYKLAIEVMEIQRDFCEKNFLMENVVDLDLSILTVHLNSGEKGNAKMWLNRLKQDMYVTFGQVSGDILKDYQVVKNLEECGIRFEELLKNPEIVNSVRVSPCQNVRN